jgi:hypothetical protein
MFIAVKNWRLLSRASSQHRVTAQISSQTPHGEWNCSSSRHYVVLPTVREFVPKMSDGRISYRMTPRFDAVVEKFYEKFEEMRLSTKFLPPLPWPELVRDFTNIVEKENRKMKFLTRIGTPKELLKRLTNIEKALLQPHFNSLEEFEATLKAKIGNNPTFEEFLVQRYALYARAREILDAFSKSLSPEQIAEEEKRRLAYRKANADLLLLTSEEIVNPPKKKPQFADHFNLTPWDYPGVTEADCKRAFYQAVKEFTPVPPQEVHARFRAHINQMYRESGGDHTNILQAFKNMGLDVSNYLNDPTVENFRETLAKFSEYIEKRRRQLEDDALAKLEKY